MANRDRKQRKRAKRLERERRQEQRRGARPRMPSPIGELDEVSDEAAALFVERVVRARLRYIAKHPEIDRDEAIRRFGDRPDDALAELSDDPAHGAQQIAYDALAAMAEGAHAEAARRAREALALDPSCADAGFVEALCGGHSGQEVARRLGEVAAITQADLAQARGIGRVDGDGVVLLRPLQRVRLAQATASRLAGDFAAAEAALRAMIADEPEEAPARFELACLLIERGDVAEAHALVARGWERDARIAWMRALVDFLRDGRRGAIAALRWAQAVELDWLDGDHDPAAQRLGAIWRAHASAEAWRGEDFALTTPDERAAAVATYADPVAGLLRLGDRPLVGEPIVAECGLTAADVPELSRLATDHAIHDHPDDDVCMGPKYAVEALAVIGGAAVLPVLVQAAIGFAADTLVSCSAAHALKREPAAMPALIAALGDPSRPPSERDVLAECLGDLGADHPALRPPAIVAVAAQLEPFAANPPELNAILISALAGMGAVEHLPLIRRAFAQDEVDTMLCGRLDDVACELKAAALRRGAASGG